MVAHGAELGQAPERLVDIAVDRGKMSKPFLDACCGAAGGVVAQKGGKVDRQHIAQRLHGLSRVEVSGHRVGRVVSGLDLVGVGGSEYHNAVALQLRLHPLRHLQRLRLHVVGEILMVDDVACGDGRDGADEAGGEHERI